MKNISKQQIHHRCFNMIGELFHNPRDTSVGTSSVGSSEATLLGVLTMKHCWKLLREAQCKPVDRLNVVMSSILRVFLVFFGKGSLGISKWENDM